MPIAMTTGSEEAPSRPRASRVFSCTDGGGLRRWISSADGRQEEWSKRCREWGREMVLVAVDEVSTDDDGTWISRTDPELRIDERGTCLRGEPGLVRELDGVDRLAGGRGAGRC